MQDAKNGGLLKSGALRFQTQSTCRKLRRELVNRKVINHAYGGSRDKSMRKKDFFFISFENDELLKNLDQKQLSFSNNPTTYITSIYSTDPSPVSQQILNHNQRANSLLGYPL